MGTTLFISSTIAKVSIIKTTKELLPFYLATLVVLGLFSFVPALTIR